MTGKKAMMQYIPQHDQLVLMSAHFYYFSSAVAALLCVLTSAAMIH
jgi:hypothetical protein